MNDGMQFGYSSTGDANISGSFYGSEFQKKWKSLAKDSRRSFDGTLPMVHNDGRVYNPVGGSMDIFQALNMNLKNQSLSEEDRASILREAGINGLDSAYARSVNFLDPSKAESKENKAFRATEQYYKLLVDKPGAKQTRSNPDLFLSNAFKGMV